MCLSRTQHLKDASMNDDYVSLSRRDTEALVKDLNLLVVSFDRLGSAFYDDPKQHAIEMSKFLQGVRAFKRLAKGRRVLLDAYKSQLGIAASERFVARLQKIKVWGEKGFRGAGGRKSKK